MLKQALAVLLAVAALVFAGYQWGAADTTAAHTAQRDKAVADAQRLYLVETRRGEKAARDFTQEYSTLQASFKTLEGQFDELSKRVPLVVYRPAPASPAGGALAVQPAAPAEHAQTVAESQAGAPGLSLSLGAVWMWNSALAGADIPAGACGAADTSSETCAADAGLGLADAWANQQANAKSCAADRLRYQHLIDFLNGRKQ